ncbi:probable enoyl-CoA hydratase echA8 [Anthonomus grandis grandis]|uniref:probable enoyl-CoA hydratase echA8 n=1 Tax=Anthonomus grandis grandis TaxID=2921223 RepID=UPI002165C242|nr:probable enoyl-CoA hydratase echA8 [Anthonomus grandis grandis]
MFGRRFNWVSRRNMSRSNNKSIIIEKLGPITTIGINRPSKRNCIDTPTGRLLDEALCTFEEDTDSSVAVLYGTGGNFCSGFDLNELAEAKHQLPPMMFPSRAFVRKPTVAALSGYTVAGGLELALMCDLRVMEDTAVIGLYGRRFGVPLTGGATVRLPALIGLSRALDLILTGRSLAAKEALDWGLVNRVVACGTGLGQALQLATCLAKFPRECLGVDRRSTYDAAFNGAFEDALKYERENAENVPPGEVVKGAKAFLGGIGRHGKSYNLTEKQRTEWEREFESENAKSKL